MAHPRLTLKPFLCEADEAHRNGIVCYKEGGTAIVRLPEQDFVVPPECQYDLTPATLFGLNERLTSSATSPVIDSSGGTLRDLFNTEWHLYTVKLAAAEATGFFNYGVFAFYREPKELVRFCPPYWHHVAAVASSSRLLADKNNSLSWRQIRDVFERTTVAVAGCSVGSSVIHSLVMDMRPCHIKIADKSVYKMENINRVRLSYWDIVRSKSEQTGGISLSFKNKAEVIADQIYSIDPFLEVYVYNEGVTAETAESFLGESEGEPATDIVVEEVDDPRIKLFIREEARKRGLPVVMVTDIGSAIQLDILRYDLDRTLPLSLGAADAFLYEKMEAVYREAGDRKVFFDFVDTLIGTHYRQGELQSILEGRSEVPTSTIIPQLGSTVAVAGGVAAEAVARIRLGYDLPPRVVINKHTFQVTFP